ncbi:MAG: helix-turn-helix domain-containing protein [Oceanipulchritudo sp.]
MRLGLMLNLSQTKGRQLLRGIHAALEGWPGVEIVQIPYHLRLWEGDPLAGLDAVLGEFDRYPQAKPFWELEIPVIYISNALPTTRFPKSVMDEAKIGRMAAEHLLGRGYEQFLVLGAAGHHAAELRAAAFVGHLEETGRKVNRLNGWFGPDNQLLEALLREVAAATAPLGIFGWTDFSAYSAVKAVRQAGRRIPEEAGIIGAGDDDILTTISLVPLSSIHLHWESVGVAAVEMLREALDGRRPADHHCQRCELIQRASTERYPVSDPRVARCLALIERDLAGGLSVPLLAKKVGCSKRSLEEQFRKELNTSPARYILERRIKRARRLLRETGLRVYEIATACGFEDANYFAAAFKRVTGKSPTEFREG